MRNALAKATAELEWGKLYVRPPKDPNHPLSISHVFELMEELCDQNLETCELVARCHAAAMGEITGPIRGVVEDIAMLRTFAENMVSTVHVYGGTNRTKSPNPVAHYSSTMELGKKLGLIPCGEEERKDIPVGAKPPRDDPPTSCSSL